MEVFEWTDGLNRWREITHASISVIFRISLAHGKDWQAYPVVDRADKWVLLLRKKS